MTKEEIAVLISIASFVLAAFALGWNIYRDIVLKPRLKVSIQKTIIASEVMEATDSLMISAVNFGPGKLNLNIVRFMHTSMIKKIFKTWKHGVLIHDYRNPLSGQLPTILDVGEKINLVFTWDKECICVHKPSHIGIADSFGRTHWAPTKDVKNIIKQWEAEFEV